MFYPPVRACAPPIAAALLLLALAALTAATLQISIGCSPVKNL